MSTFFAYNNILVGNGNRVLGIPTDPYNPLDLPERTIRVKFAQGYPLNNAADNHKQTFYNCGSNTTTGAAELAQIPSDWKT